MIKTLIHNLSKIKYLLNIKMVKIVALIFLVCHLFNMYYYYSLKDYQNIPDAELGYARFPGKNWVYWLPCDSSSTIRINYNDIPLKADNEIRVFIFFNYRTMLQSSFGAGRHARDNFCNTIKNIISTTLGKKISIVMSIQDDYRPFQFLRLADFLITEINPDYSILLFLSDELYSFPNIAKESLSLQTKQYFCSIPIVWKLLLYIRPNYRSQDFRDITCVSVAKRFNFTDTIINFKSGKDKITSFSKKSPIVVFFTYWKDEPSFIIENSNNCLIYYFHENNTSPSLVLDHIKSAINQQKQYIIKNE